MQQEKTDFKPGNMLYPLPAVMVSCGTADGTSNIFTVAWTGTVCTNPPMVSVSVRPERYSYGLIRDSGEFVINLVTEDLVRAMDYCGVRSGRDTDKWADCGLTKAASGTVACPGIAQAPVNIECRVRRSLELGSHTLFLAEVTAVRVDGAYLKEGGAFDLNAAKLVTYSHGTYFSLGQALGTFGFSIRKEKKGAKGRTHAGRDRTAKPEKAGRMKRTPGEKPGAPAGRDGTAKPEKAGRKLKPQGKKPGQEKGPDGGSRKKQ